MRSVILPAATAAVLLVPASGALADGPGLPPTDVIKVTQCQPDYPCDPEPYVDTTYPKRVIGWALDLVP